MQKGCSVPPAPFPCKTQARFYRILVPRGIVMSAFCRCRENQEGGDRMVCVSACSVRGLHPTRGGGKGGGRQRGLSLQRAPPPSISSTFFHFPVPLFPLPIFQSYRAVKTCPPNSDRRIIPRSAFVTGIHGRSPLAIWHYQFCSLWQSLSP